MSLLPDPSPNLGGRPTKYRPEYAEQTRKLCALGAIDLELADFFEVSLRTINAWKVAHADFSEAVRLGKAVADERVESSLFNRAVGYSFDSVKILSSEGRVFNVPYVEHCPPDVTACRFWLVNRRPKEWRLTPAPIAGDETDLLAQIEADAPRYCPDEPGPANPIL